MTAESLTFISLDRELYFILLWSDVVDVLKKNTKVILEDG